MNNFTYNYNSSLAYLGISDSLKLLYKSPFPVIICVGSDLAVGDSLGPLIGSQLLDLLKGKAYVYGTLQNPITAKEIETVSKTINSLHPKSKILVVDAALGDINDVGLIKILDSGISPGKGVGKTLNVIGDVSIISIVSSCEHVNGLYNDVRLSFVKKVSNVIVKGILEYFK
jgi:putative sporulation protein YyaC